VPPRPRRRTARVRIARELLRQITAHTTGGFCETLFISAPQGARHWHPARARVTSWRMTRARRLAGVLVRAVARDERVCETESEPPHRRWHGSPSSDGCRRESSTDRGIPAAGDGAPFDPMEEWPGVVNRRDVGEDISARMALGWRNLALSWPTMRPPVDVVVPFFGSTPGLQTSHLEQPGSSRRQAPWLLIVGADVRVPPGVIARYFATRPTAEMAALAGETLIDAARSMAFEMGRRRSIDVPARPARL
jgi:hypothetical protein